MRENSTARPRYVLFTIALELPVTDSKEAAEMRGYNWLARRLRPRYARSSDAELLSFNTVAVDAEKLRYAPEGGTESARTQPRPYGYIVRLHGDFNAGDSAPDWLVQTLSVPDDGGPVRFRGITEARAAPLTGRPG